MRTLLAQSLGLALAVFLGGCAGTPDVSRNTDSFAGGERYATETFYLHKLPGAIDERPNEYKGTKGGEDELYVNPNAGLEMRFTRHAARAANNYTIGLIYSYRSDDPIPLNLGGKNSLRFDIDGRTVTLSTDNRSAQNGVRAGGLFGARSIESVVYRDVPASLIRDLAKAKNVVVIAASSNGDIKGQFSPVMYEALVNLQGTRTNRQVIAE